MVAEGLRGPFCWAVEMLDGDYSLHSESARIASAPAPASPTEEELAGARAWAPPSESDDDY